MPKVGKKHFKYTKAGYAKAKAYAKKVGKKILGRAFWAAEIPAAVKYLKRHHILQI